MLVFCGVDMLSCFWCEHHSTVSIKLLALSGYERCELCAPPYMLRQVEEFFL